MDLRLNHGSNIYVVRACYKDDATDLVAVGGENLVQILQVSATKIASIASFHIGTRITALAWSSRTISPSSSDEWIVELTAASADFGLYLLTKSSAADENIFAFGGGLSGHHGKVNDMSFCGGHNEDSFRYVATVSDDKMLVVWDLYPNLDTPSRSPDLVDSAPRPQPTAYVIPFTHPLTTVSSHPSTSKEFLVSDNHGCIFLTDWRSDPEEGQDTWRHSSVIELIDPHALSDSLMGLSGQWSGSVAWRRDAIDIVGATYGSKFSIWDVSKMGGKPSASGTSFPEGGHQFRWCPTYPDFFGISSKSPIKGAVIHIHNAGYIHAQPTVFNIAPRPHQVRDFDFLACQGIPRVAAAVGHELVIFSIGVEP